LIFVLFHLGSVLIFVSQGIDDFTSPMIHRHVTCSRTWQSSLRVPCSPWPSSHERERLFRSWWATNTSLLNNFVKPTGFDNSNSTGITLLHPGPPLCCDFIVPDLTLTEPRKHLVMGSKSIYYVIVSDSRGGVKRTFYLHTLPRSWHATLTRSVSVFSPSRTQTRGS
jgi:hypothetical protein